MRSEGGVGTRLQDAYLKVKVPALLEELAARELGDRLLGDEAGGGMPRSMSPAELRRKNSLSL
jgi:hypothetical protein